MKHSVKEYFLIHGKIKDAQFVYNLLRLMVGAFVGTTLLKSVESGSGNLYVNLQIFCKHCKYFVKNEILFAKKNLNSFTNLIIW